MLLNFSQIVALLGITAAGVQAIANPYGTRAIRRTRVETKPVGLIHNGRFASAPAKVKKDINPNNRGETPTAPRSRKVKSDIYLDKFQAKTKKAPTRVMEKVAMAQEQFMPLRPSAAPLAAAEEPGYAWQRRTITVTVTRGFERIIITTTINVTNTIVESQTEYVTGTINTTVWETISEQTTETETDYTTEYTTTSIGPTSTVSETTTETSQETVTSTEWIPETTTITYGSEETVWQTNYNTVTEWSTSTTTSTIIYPETTVITPMVTTTGYIPGETSTLFETSFGLVTSTSTLQTDYTTTDVEIVYETPAFMRY